MFKDEGSRFGSLARERTALRVFRLVLSKFDTRVRVGVGISQRERSA